MAQFPFNLFGTPRNSQGQGQGQGQQGQGNQSSQNVNNMPPIQNQQGGPQNQNMNMMNPQGQGNPQGGGNQNQNPQGFQQGNQNPQGSTDPLMDFNALWQNPNSTDPNSQSQTPAKKTYLPQYKPEDLQQTVQKWDFTSKSLTPERVQAITAGGQGAVDALRDIINEATRTAALTAFQASSRLAEVGFTNAEAGFLEKVPTHVRSVITENSLTSTNPLMQDPRYQPMVEVVRLQAEQRWPKATPDQISKVVNSYFDQMYNDLTGKRQQQQQKVETNDDKIRTGAQDADWDAWANEGLPENIFGEPPPQNQNQTQNPNQNQNPAFGQNSNTGFSFG